MINRFLVSSSSILPVTHIIRGLSLSPRLLIVASLGAATFARSYGQFRIKRDLNINSRERIRDTLGDDDSANDAVVVSASFGRLIVDAFHWERNEKRVVVIGDGSFF